MKRKRRRMIFDLPPCLQMAIRLAAMKQSVTTGEIVAQAMHNSYPNDVVEALRIIEGNSKGGSKQ